MPDYRLWCEADNEYFDPEHARDDAHAVAIFSQRLGVSLTLQEGPFVSTYMMARRDRPEGDGPPWVKYPDIPVWVKGDNSSN